MIKVELNDENYATLLQVLRGARGDRQGEPPSWSAMERVGKVLRLAALEAATADAREGASSRVG